MRKLAGLTLAGALLLDAGAAAAQEPPRGRIFAAPVQVDAGRHPSGFGVADFDADGRADLVVAHSTGVYPGHPAEGATVLRSDGAGGFRATTLPGGSTSVATGDLNSDRRADVVTTDRDRDLVQVFLGDGRGGFAAPVQYSPYGAGPESVAAADLDADGDLDLAVGNRSGDIALFDGDGTGTFAEPRRFRTRGAFPGSLAAADLDGDGAADLAMASYGSAGIARNDGTGAFTAVAALDLRTSRHALLESGVTAADIDADGDPDLAFSSDGHITLLRNDGRGGLGAPERHATGQEDAYGPPAVADLNGDGAPDLAVADGSDNQISVLLADGRNGYHPPVSRRVRGTAWGLAAADVDGDCAPDLAVAAIGVSVFLNTRQMACAPATGPPALPRRGPRPLPAPPPFGPPAVFPGPAERTPDVAAADFDNDGTTDLALMLPRAREVAVLLGDGRGGFGPARRVPTPAAPPPPPATGGPERMVASGQAAGLAAGDVDADGKPDLVVNFLGNRSGAGFLRGDGAGGFVLATRFPSRIEQKAAASPPEAVWQGPPRLLQITLGDVDGDGNLDLVRPEGRDGTTILRGDGRGGFRPAVALPAAGADPTLADIDGDADLDLVLLGARRSGPSHSPTYAGAVTVLRNRGDGTFSAPVRTPTGSRVDRGVEHLAVGDLDGDGRPDVAVTDADEWQVVVLHGDGTGAFAAARRYDTGGSNPGALDIAEVTGDGVADLIVANTYSNEVALLAGQRSGGVAPAVRLPVGGRDIAALAAIDADADGAADLVTVNNLSLDVSVRLNRIPAALAAGAIGRVARGTPVRPQNVDNPVDVTAGFPVPQATSRRRKSTAVGTSSTGEAGSR